MSPSLRPSRTEHRSLLRILLTVGTLCTLLRPADSAACGPHYSSPHLAWLGADMLDSPRSHFPSDLARMVKRTVPPGHVHTSRLTTREGDALDLRAALGDAANAEALTTAYLEARADPSKPLPDGLPTEFRLYAEAVQHMHTGDVSGARERFAHILSLPPKQRQFRSIWAAYMVARMMEKEEADSTAIAAAWHRVPKLAKQGFVDTIGLATSSLYHASISHWKSREWEAHVNACFAYRALGGARGCHSFDQLAQEVLESDPATLPQLMRTSPRTTELVATWLTSAPTVPWKTVEGIEDDALPAHYVSNWLEAAGTVRGGVEGADRLAWAAYQSGAYEQAARWVARAKADAPIARWIDGKLALRRGDLPAATAALEAAVDALPAPAAVLFHEDLWRTGCTHNATNPARALLEELGIVLVAGGRYVDAMETFLKAGDWADAAWIAERLLTVDELRHWVDGTPPPHQYDPDPEAGSLLGYAPTILADEVPSAMTHLLGRRLMRLGQHEQALEYLQGGPAEQTKRLRTLLKEGRDPEQTPTQRGEALWAAAKLVKAQGWELFATELEPDFRSLNGGFQMVSTAERRSDTAEQTTEDPIPVQAVRRLLAPTPQEQARIAAHAPLVNRRYHFVYTAQDLALEAVQLLPADHRSLPEALCVGAGWTRTRDPDRADAFWKLLYHKAPRTERVQAMLDRGWWPPLQQNGQCAWPDPVEAPPPPPACSASPIQRSGWLLLLLWAPIAWIRQRS